MSAYHKDTLSIDATGGMLLAFGRLVH